MVFVYKHTLFTTQPLLLKSHQKWREKCHTTHVIQCILLVISNYKLYSIFVIRQVMHWIINIPYTKRKNLTLRWLQTFLEDADNESRTGCVISSTVWNNEAATMKRMIDMAPKRWGRPMSIRPVCKLSKNMTNPSVKPLLSAVFGGAWDLHDVR